jgi:serine-type D-Ala-D-Ala carboxypeptidase/endopeptidase (penicillin-binding protein 4)
VLTGDLVVVGSGDPLLMTDAYERHFRRHPAAFTDVEAFADAIAAEVRTIRGSVVGDGTRYDDERYVPLWPARYIADDEIGPLGALTIDDGFVTFPPSEEVRVPDETPAADPALHAAQRLTQLLVERGVEIEGPARSGEAPDDAVEVVGIDSPPIRAVVGELLRESDNQTAELLLKELGVRRRGNGSTNAGTEAVEEILLELGLPVAGVDVADGSGLARENRQTCAAVQALLDRAGPESVIGIGLPIAGRSGTLEKRFLENPAAGRLWAKTGSLNQVTGLAGFLETIPGAEMSFVFLANLPPGVRVDEDDFALQDELAATLTRYPEGPVLVDLGPKSLEAE